MVMITVLLYPLQHNKNCITQNPLCSSPINYEYSFTFSQKFWPVILSRAMSISAEYFAKSCQGNRRVTKLHNNYITEYNRSYRRLFKCKNNDTIWSRVDPGRSKPSADYIPGNPSAHNISPSLSSALCHARPSKVRRPAGERSEEDDGTAAGPFTSARPPMGGRATIERLLNGALPARRYRSVPGSGPSTCTAPLRALAVMASPEHVAASGGSRFTCTVCGSIHIRRWWPRDEHN
jgi:hypothetical protein